MSALEIPEPVEIIEDFEFHGVDRCCCGSVHVKRGTYIIAYISAFFIVTNLLMKIAGYSETAWDWELLFLVVDTIALASLFYGVYAKRPAFIQPFVVLSLITTSFLMLLAASMVCAAYDPNSYSGQDLELELHKRLTDFASRLSLQFKSMISIVASVFLIFILLSIATHCWFIMLAVQCAKYFRILELREEQANEENRTK
ncbi:hypothetical protein M3Y98_01193000 [Aphelenchoides besseyi]|nr:hypothetical protein M3Y98_01193000 [Aphelenchoides besseyi]KAI6195070.1 hypothetical protein M3Y96_01192000 [Aphelenchoides besseyi]